MNTVFIDGNDITMQLKVPSAFFAADFKRQGNTTQQ
jgi:hypothetical protein